MLNTFGGTWWSAKPNGTLAEAKVDQPAFKKALRFYIELVQDAGEQDAASSSFNECLAQYQAGKVAMWYDATVAAGLLEATDSPVKGKNGYAPAPVEQTKASGWLWSWALAIPQTSPDPTAPGGTSPGRPGRGTSRRRGRRRGRLGRDPAGHAPLDLRDPGVQEGRARVRSEDTRRDRVRADRRSGHDQAPGHPGVQYVGIPQFQDVGNQCTQLFSSVIAGSTSDTARSSQCQQIASEAIK